MISRGSEWKRWEPHIHAPGTVLNDQFSIGVDNSWEQYLSALENASPRIEAIAITDYYVTDTYEEALRRKKSGRLTNIQLIFPNVELRLDVAAKKGFVNIHLLVSPEDPDHLNQLHRILARLQFRAFGDSFNCARSDLITLGRRARQDIVDEKAALEHGATQFKVNFKELREVYAASEWAQKNILVAVAGAEDDGTSGVRQAADATIRQEIEGFAHIIFSGSPAQREFWLGQKSMSSEKLRERYNGCKPCLHGSDSHSQKAVGVPDFNRFTWIKGGLEFDALRQACIDPAGRAHVGELPPQFAMPSQIISHVSIAGADWMLSPEIPLNPGLVAIIGARGSGKTALADVIAAGCDAIAPLTWRREGNSGPSFLARAMELVGNASVTLTWGGGDTSTRSLNGSDANGSISYPRARYLSQQFVEELCSSTGASDGLIEEIERVIFEAHSTDGKGGAINFSELRDSKVSRYRQMRRRETEAITDLSDRIAIELEKESQVKLLWSQVSQKEALIENYLKDQSKLVLTGTEQQSKRYSELSAAAESLREKIQKYNGQRDAFLTMRDEVTSTREARAPELLRQFIERHSHGQLAQTQWEEFLLVYKGDVDKSLAAYLAKVEEEISRLQGKQVATGEPNQLIVADDVNLSLLDMATLRTEMKRIEIFLSADKLVRDQYVALNKRINEEKAALKKLQEKLHDAQGAAARRKELQQERSQAYGRAFDAVISEQEALADLYAPLMERLALSDGTLRKLSFSVRRIVDVKSWGSVAEEHLLDLRRSGPFYGRGSLIKMAEEKLKAAWETGSALEIQTGLSDFVSAHINDLLRHAPYSSTDQSKFREWSKQFAHWLYGSEHISIQYEILYDGIDIRKLSPGTRGIVLLLLYLALDEADDKPLIIDQPEENLDPRSVFEELVTLFVDAKKNRQVIIVTHNANLVINTDADQIIVAESGPHSASGLPPITYKAGGLENSKIRESVCNILEGGDSAFRERARRLRVRLER